MANNSVVNYIPTFYLSTGRPAASYYFKAYQAGGVSTAITTYTSASDNTGGTKFQLNELGQPASGGTAFAPHFKSTADAWIFPTSAEADANDTTNAIQVIDASGYIGAAKVIDTISDLQSNTDSQITRVTLTGHTTKGDGGGGEFWLDTSDTSTSDDNGINIVDSQSPRTGTWSRLPEYGIYAAVFGVTGDGSTDDTTAFQAAATYAMANKKVLYISGAVKLTDTTTITGSASLIIKGEGERTTSLVFHNVTSDKVMFDLASDSSNTRFEDMHIKDNTPGTSTFMKIQDDLPDTDGQSHYKDSTRNCRITDFKTAVHITTTDPTDGATHAFCSEPMFFHTRFKNNRTTFLIENLQAVDITLVGSDIENDDSGESYTFFKDIVGATINVYGGSFVGKGLVYECEQAGGSSSLWQAGKFSMKSARLELRSTHNGTVLSPVASAFATEGTIVLEDCIFLLFSQTIDLIDFGGKTDLLVRSCKAFNGTLQVKQSPTTGISGSYVSADGYYKTYGNVVVEDCYGIEYVKNTSSSYGTYEERYTAPVIVRNRLGSPTDGSYSIDSNGWMTLSNPSFFQRGVGIGYAETSRIVYNMDRPASSFTDIKFVLPFGATPTKLIMFKHPNNRSTDLNYKLYAVKDVADWVDSGTPTFAVGTDAIEIADSGSTANKAGYLEFSIALTDSHFDSGTYFQSGLGDWTEGKLFLELQSGSMSGFVGVEYM